MKESALAIIMVLLGLLCSAPIAAVSATDTHDQGHMIDNGDWAGPRIAHYEDYRRPLFDPVNVTISQIQTAKFPIIELYVRATDVNLEDITGLNASNFAVQEDGTDVTSDVEELERESSVISVALVIDSSGSMSGGKLDAAKQAACDFVDGMCSLDRGCVIDFDDSARVVQEFTSNKALLQDAINAMSASGGTALFDGAYLGLEQCSGEAGIRAGIVLTDGRSGSCQHSLQDVVDYAVMLGIPIYTIGLGSDVDPGPLEYMSDNTGGYYQFAPSAEDIQDLYDNIAASLQNQYLVAYTSPNPSYDGSTREVTVTVLYEGDFGSDTDYYVASAPPVIARTDETTELGEHSQPRGGSLTIQATITDDVGITEARLFYRTTGAGGYYTQVDMVNVSEDLYSYRIPGSEVDQPGEDYFISASDGITTTTDPPNRPQTQPYQIPVFPNEKPVVDHQPVRVVPEGASILISASITDTTDCIDEALLFYRPGGHIIYQSTALANVSDNTWEVEIQWDDAWRNAGVDYYLLAEDNYGVGTYDGTDIDPHHIIYCSDLPELVGGTVEPDSGTNFTMFDYSVRYYHSKGYAPAVQRVYIDGIARNMANIDGTVHQYSMNLPAGEHSFYFYFEDEYGGYARLPQQGAFEGPSVEHNDAPVLSQGQVSPNLGTADTSFTYSVHYFDENGHLPTTKLVYIDGNPHPMAVSEVASPDYGTAAAGINAAYTYSTTLSPGEHSFYFYFEDGYDAFDREPSQGSLQGPSVNHNPSVYEGSVVPGYGTAHTVFTLRIRYHDIDGHTPSVKNVYIDGDLGHEMSLESGAPENGTYAYQTVLPVGTHSFFFYFEDGHGGSARDPRRGTHEGPSSIGLGTDYYVDALNGDNATGNGTEASPWKTISFALDSTIGSVDHPVIVHVAPGTYDTTMEGGEAETFPLILDSYDSLVGEDPSTTIVSADETNRIVTCEAAIGVAIEGLTLAGGSAEGDPNCGAAIHCKDSMLNVLNCTITGNNASKYGAGIYAENSELTISRCTINANSAYSGGGIYIRGCSPNISNSLISSNDANQGAGIYCYSSSPLVSNCTFVNNQASGGGGAIYSFSSSHPEVINSILWNNSTAETGTGHYGQITIDYSCIRGGHVGEGNISDQPLFMDPADRDYRLGPSSPCIDSGSNADVVGDADLDGCGRIVFGTVDMGAYEFQKTGSVTQLEFGEEHSDLIGAQECDVYSLNVDAGLSVVIYVETGEGTEGLAIFGRRVATRPHWFSSRTITSRGGYELLISPTLAGTYYFYVYGRDIVGEEGAYRIVARSVERYLSDLTPRQASDAGRMTLTLTGLGFVDGMGAELRDPGGETIAAESVARASSTKLFARFDLSGIGASSYDVAAIWPAGEQETLSDAFEVISGGIGPRLNASLNGPDSTRTYRIYTLWLEYENTGDTDLDAPLFIVTGKGPTQNSKDIINFSLLRDGGYAPGPVQVLGVNTRGLASTIPPGTSARVPVYFKGPYHAGNFSFSLSVLSEDNTDPIDWPAHKDGMQPPDMTNEEWDALWPALIGRFGDTWPEYVAVLREGADRLRLRGVEAYMIQELVALEARMLRGLPVAAITGELVDAETGSPLVEVPVRARASEGTVIRQVLTSNPDGLFLLDDLPDGDYELLLEGYYLDPRVEVTISDGQDSNGNVLHVYKVPDESHTEQPIGTPSHNPDLVVDDDGNAYLAYERGSELYWASNSGSGWNSYGPLTDDKGSSPALEFTPGLLDQGASPGLFCVWTTGTTMSTLKWQAGRVLAQDVLWSEPEPLTFDDNADFAPAVVFDGEGNAVVLWLQTDLSIEDDTDLYYDVVDPDESPLLWIVPVSEEEDQEAQLLSTTCIGVEIKKEKSLPKWIPIIGGEHKFKIEGKACGEPGCEPSLSGKLEVALKLSKALEGSGYVDDLKVKWDTDPEQCVYVFDYASVTLGVGIEGKITSPPIPIVVVIPVLCIPIKIGDATVSGILKAGIEGTLVWKSNFPSWPDEGIVAIVVGGGLEGEVKLVAGVVGALARGTLSLEFQVSSKTRAIVFKGYCVELMGQVYISYGWGRWKVDWTKEWGPACDKVSEIGPLGTFSTNDLLRTACFEITDDGVPVYEEVVFTKDMTRGTGSIYESRAVLPDIQDDLDDDGVPAVARTAAGEVIAAWTKDVVESDDDLGAKVVAATYEGDGWSVPVEITPQVDFNKDTAVAFDSNGDPMVVWSRASSQGLNFDDDIEVILAATEVSDVTFSIRRGGVWSPPERVLDLAGRDEHIDLAAGPSGQFTAVWVNNNGTVSSIYASMYDGSDWSNPMRIACTAAADPPKIAYVSGKPTVVWAQDTDGDSNTYDDWKLASSVYDGTWSSPVIILDLDDGLMGSLTSQQELASYEPMSFGFSPPDECCDEDEDGEKDGEEDNDPDPPDPPDDATDPADGDSSETVRSDDPNEKAGPKGVGEQHFVNVGERLDYIVYFENKSGASAPAQEVFVDDYLDGDLDWSSVRVEAVSFGDLLIPNEQDSPYFYSRTTIPDYRFGDDKLWWVETTGEFDLSSGCLSFALRTLDPETGELPEDVDAGFLPPEDGTGRGQGYVSFSANARDDLEPGTVIRNRASIVFDVNEPIVTNEVFNTIADVPASSCTSPEYANSWPIQVEFSNDDGGLGFAKTYLYYRFGDEDWALYAECSGATIGSFDFEAEAGEGTYCFQTVVEDPAGKISEWPSGYGHSCTLMDTTLPQSTCSSPALTNSPRVHVTYEASDLGGSELTEVALWLRFGDSGDWTDTGLVKTSEDGAFDFAAANGDGTYYFQTVARDYAGNIEPGPSGDGDASTVIDTVIPQSHCASPAFAKSPEITVSYETSDIGVSGLKRISLWYKFGSSGAWTDTGLTKAVASGSFQFSAPNGQGAYYFQTIATDRAGNVEVGPSGSGDSSTVLDSTAPTSRCQSPTFSKSRQIIVTYSASDTGSGLGKAELYYRFERSSVWNKTGLASSAQKGSFEFTAAQGDGSYYFQTIASDKAGNAEAELSGEGDSSTLLDTIPPSSRATAPSQVSDAPFEVGFTASDTGSGVKKTTLKYRFESESWQSWPSSEQGESGNFSFEAPEGEGKYEFYTLCTDEAGNTEAAPSYPDATTSYHVPKPNISVTPDRLEFGQVNIGQEKSQLLGIANVGDAELTITGISTQNAAFEVFLELELPAKLVAGDSLSVEVKFAPEKAGPVTSRCVVLSDDPDSPSIVVTLNGEGIAAGELTVAVSCNAEEFAFGDTLEVDVAAENTGESVTVDVYLALIYAFGQPGQRLWSASLLEVWTEGLVPLLTDFQMENGLDVEMQWWSSVLPSNLPMISRSGDYMLAMAAAEPGTLDLATNLSTFEFVVTGEPFVGVSTDRDTYSISGDTILVSLGVMLPDYSMTADFYLVLLGPNGQFWSPTNFGTDVPWQANVVPLIPAFDTPASIETVLDALVVNLPAAAPFDTAGQYALFSALVEPGTLAPLSDVGAASFTLQ